MDNILRKGLNGVTPGFGVGVGVDRLGWIDFDWRSSGIFPLVVDRRQVVEARVGPVRVVPGLDEAEDGHARLGLGLEAATGQEFALKGCEEALAHRVIVTIRDRSHRRANAGFFAS